MANSCGIDLGTTNSCIVIVAEGEPKVVRDKYKRATVPSVIFQSGGGDVVVGHAAKSRLGQMPPPVITVKRKMGTDEQVQLGGKLHSAVEVSAMILRHLKRMGEEEAQTTLENLVVTVPAYFNFKQKQDTETAARQAGFEEVVVLQEPVAAALAYCVNAGDEPMTVLAYDLGGGTFDVTVLERTADNEINVLAFGGDPWLGGDDFDTQLAEYLRRRLKAKNYAVDWDLTKPEQYAKFQRLKEQAEDAKKKLSNVPEVSINFPQVFCDEEGVLIDLEEIITRELFYGLVEEKLNRSIELTQETLAKSGVSAQQLTKLIMVGGSSYIPMIQDRLRQALGVEPELVDPETIVAMGAAIKAAASFGRKVDGNGISVVLDYQSKSSRTKTSINGRLSQKVQGWTAMLVQGDYESTLPLNGDRFRFDGILLSEGKLNEFALTLEDGDGEERLFADVSITQDNDATMLRSPDALIAKPIAVRTVSGLEVVIDAGARLPTRVNRIFHTEDQSGEIVVPIYEGSVPIAEVKLTDVPKNLTTGSEVEVDLIFNKDYSVNARARVLSTGHEAHAQFEIPLITVLTADQVKTKLKAIEARREQLATLVDDPSFDSLRRMIWAELDEPEPKMAKVTEDINELESLLLPAEAKAAERQALRPSLSEVERRLDEADKNARQKAEKSTFDLDEFLPHTAKLRNKAQDCWERRDASGWREVLSILAGLESLAAPSRDINQMPESEARDMAMALVFFIESEVMSKPAARELLAGIDLDKLKFAAVIEPHKAVGTGIQLLRMLVTKGITEIPGAGKSQDTGISEETPGNMAMLKGLLRSGRG